MRAWVVAAAGLLGCTELECGIGTVEREGQCVPTLVVACGPGTRYERGYCVVADAGSEADATADGDAPSGEGN